MKAPPPLVVHATYCYFALQVALVILLIATAVGKSVAFSEPLDYVIHFTNWSWTLQIIFYTLTLSAAVPACTSFAATVVALLALPLAATVSSVAVIVWILLGSSDGTFMGTIDLHPGFVMIGNDWFHLLPLGFLLLFFLVWAPLVYYALYRLFTSEALRENPRCLAVVIVYEVWGFFVLVAAYFAVLAALGTNVHEVYGTELNVGAGLTVAALVAFVVNGSILFVLARCYGVCSRVNAAQEALLRRRVTSTAYEDTLEEELERWRRQ